MRVGFDGQRTINHGRRGFTLIELLVVMAIIAVLVGITLPAIQRVRDSANRTRASSDISQITSAVGNFMTTYNCPPPPTQINLSPSSTGNALTFLKKVWPRLNMATVPNMGLLDGNKSMQFFLGGPGYSGFSNDSQNPFSGTKTAAFMEFPQKQVVGGYFVDPWGTPYFYAASYNGNDYNRWGNCTIGAQTYQPMKDSAGNYLNRNTVQVVSAGRNKAVGNAATWTPGTGVFTPTGPGGDDLSNFHDKTLGAP